MRVELKNIREYLKPVVGVILVLISIKPALFTWHLIGAGSDYRLDKQRAAVHMYKCLLIKPSVYKAFKKHHRPTADGLVIKSAIYNNDIHRLRDAHPEPADIARIKSTFKDDFYLGHLFPGFMRGAQGKKPNPEHLDDVTLEILADPSMNPLTISILKKIVPGFSRDFAENLADFCQWKGNRQLVDFLAAAGIEKNSLNKPAFVPLNLQQSTARLKEILPGKYKQGAFRFGGNLLTSPGFDDIKKTGRNWRFSDMTDYKPFAAGSFTMGPDSAGKNGMLRIMGFFVAKEKNRANPRGGAWYKKRIPIDAGHYLFSFDYAAKTGKENPSFYLGKSIGEKRLPPTNGGWKKVIFILDNTGAKLKILKPLIRMWGTGSLWIDNVFLAKIEFTGPSIPIPGTFLAVKDAKKKDK